MSILAGPGRVALRFDKLWRLPATGRLGTSRRAPRGLGRFEVFEPRQAGPFQHPAAVAEPAEAVAGDTPTVWAIGLPVSR